MSKPATFSPVVVAYLVTVLLFAVGISKSYRPATGFTSLIQFGSQFYERSLPQVKRMPHVVQDHSGGYDGQFYAQLAVDPFLRDRNLDTALDTPPYRARRMLFALTAYVLGEGKPERVVRAYAWQNVIAWFVLAVFLTRWLPPTSWRNFLPWVGCLFSSGLIQSVLGALLEGPSMVLFACAVTAMERGRPGLAAGALGLAGLGRETNLVASGAVLDRVPRSAQLVVRLALLLAAVALPAYLWSLYVSSVYPTFTYSNPDSFSLPLTGYFSKWATTISDLRTVGWNTDARYCLPSLISLPVQVGFLMVHREWRSAWWRLALPYCVMFAFLSPLVWEGYPGAADRVLLPVTVAFNVLVPRSRWAWPLAVLGNLPVMYGLAELPAPLLGTLLRP